MHPGITILIYMCLANYCFIPGTVIEDSDVLWSVLLDLHSKHCGEIDMCHVHNSNHIEPSAGLFPQPCCVPCSCSATCESNQNCCPSRMRFKTISDVTSTPSDTGKEAATTSERNRVDNESNTSTEHMLSGSDILNEGNARKSNQIVKRNHSETLNIARGIRAETWLDNITIVEKSTSSVITVKILHNETFCNKSDIDDSSSNNSVEIACIRPQMFYRLNAHPDSDAYEMVTSCPAEFKDTKIVERCRAGQSHENIADVIPMTSKHSGLAYVNKYCLFCNEHVQQSESVDEWRINTVCHRTSYSHLILPHPQFLKKLINYHFCNVHFVPKNLTALRKCKLYDVVSCNKTGLWENYDYSIEKACNAGEYLPIIHTVNGVNGDRLLFKNIACVLCNILSGISNISRYNCGYYSSTPNSRQILSVNFHSFGGFPASDKEDISVAYIETAALRELRSETCPDDSILLLGRCRKTICPSDHYEEMEQCIPIYNTLTGLDINFKIKVTPEQDVHGKVAIDVAKELKQNVSSHLTNLISLQTRDITVWFLPKIGEKTIRSFLLDIFLYNASKKVKYNRAVLELHDFFYAIKSLNRLQISKDTTLGVTYEMGHKLDYGDQLGNLYHLTGGGLKQYTNTNHLTISDVNWCIRTEFTANETEILGRNVFRVKKTNTFLSKDQCFIDFSVDPIILYTCIDYFVDDGVKGNKNPKILTKVSKTSVNTEHATSKLPLPAVGTVVAVLVAVMLTIMLLKMIYKRRERQ